MAEVRAQIKTYAAENGTSKAGRHFSEWLGRKVAESSARRCKPEYLQRIKQMASHRGCGESPLVKKSQLTKPRGRLLLLGDALDKAVQDYITAMITIGGVVNTSIVMAAAEGIVSAHDVSKLGSNGGHIHLTKTWVKSLLKRMG